MTEPLPPAPIVWRPSTTSIERSQLTRFARTVGRDVHPYSALHAWSIGRTDAFWGALWDFAEVIGDRGDEVLTVDGDRRMSGARFFGEARLNLAENLLRGPDDRLAIIASDESGATTELTMGELRTSVARTQHALRDLGVEPGDRVAGILPNTVDAAVALLATTASGAIWTGCSPDLGTAALLDRLGQVDPKVIVAQSVSVYNGRTHDVSARLRETLADLPTVEHLVLTGPGDPAELDRLDVGVHPIDDLRAGQPTTPVFPRFGFDHPAYILYTSGTTGPPKCITHRAGGSLLTHLKEHLLHGDVRPGDRVAYYTSTAWMMYHWQLSALAAGATLILYDGAALPRSADGVRDPGVLWDLAARTNATHFGTSPGYLRAVETAGYVPNQHHDLSALRMVMSAGAPLQPAQFHWAYANITQDMCLASISGGTEILGCFVMGNPTLPVRAGEIQGPALGMAVAALDDRGLPVVDRPGDLVCTEPFPSMPLRFWGEDGEARYRAAYLDERPEVWTHGDLAEFRSTGGVVIHGRTDSTLKPGGVRIGTAEIYRVVETVPPVDDALVIGYPTGGDMELWLFVTLADGHELDEPLTTRIRATLREQASPRHAPARVLQVPAIPYTHNGKKVEGTVRDVLVGAAVTNRASLRNPDALAAFEALAVRPDVGTDAGAAIGTDVGISERPGTHRRGPVAIADRSERIDV